MAPDRLHHPDPVENLPETMGPVAIHNEVGQRIKALLSGEIDDINLPVHAIRHFTREELTTFEAMGIVFSGTNAEHPDGGVYLKDAAISTLSLPPVTQMPTNNIKSVTATGFLRGATGLITRPPIREVPKDISGLKRFPMNALVAAVFKDGEWTESHVLPDGKWVVSGYDNTAFQYGQTVFEGMVASHSSELDEPMEVKVDSSGKITIFRPEENAKRFQNSCESVSLPPISVEQFLASVYAAVRNNKNFVPKDGKLYVRPFMVGLEGGTGIQPAKSCLFSVEVSPYGTYLSANSDGIDLDKELPGSKIQCINYQRPPSGKNKSAGNYGAMTRAKHDAKEAGFNDVLLIDDKRRIQECASNNAFFVEHDSDTHFVVLTSSLEANILPGITRASIIELLKNKELVKARFGKDINVTVIDDLILSEDSILCADGAFGSGTAAGIGNFHEITLTTGRKVAFKKGTETQRFIRNLYDLLQDARRGKVPGYEHWVTEVA